MTEFPEFDGSYQSEENYEIEELGDRLGNLLLMMGIIISGLLILILLWKFCFTENDDSGEPNQIRPREAIKGTPHAVFAHEIEPGFIVLQTQDGQFFRILQEYDNAKWNRTAAKQSAACVNASGCRHGNSSTWRPITEVESVYTPHYTSAHYQTLPSAPLSAHISTDYDSELINFDPGSPPPDYLPPYETGN